MYSYLLLPTLRSSRKKSSISAINAYLRLVSKDKVSRNSTERMSSEAQSKSCQTEPESGPMVVYSYYFYAAIYL